MLKTYIDIKDCIFDWLSATSLPGMISGSVYKDQRPLNSDKEDIIISVLAGNGGKQIQEASVNVNIYVPDIQRGGDMIEDTARLRLLSETASEELDYNHLGDRIFELELQEIHKVNGLDWHVINNRIRVLFSNE